jgi:glucose-6-phosphate 1-dehydrogenase
VQITVAEDLGLERRGGYYDKAGALRDMVQNHVTQLVTLIAMEVPSAFEAEAIRYEKVKVLRTIKPIGAEDVVFGQYGKGKVGDAEVPAYKDEPGVAKGTRTETFVGMKLELDSWRWQGVPFYIRSGKRLARRLTEIAVIFRKPPVAMFQSLGTPEVDSNVLLITLQPQEGFSLLFDVKAPGDPFTLQTLPLHFNYGEAFGELPEAYETLIVDVLTGNQTLFVHADEVEASWGLYTPLLGGTTRVLPYAAGSWGPAEIDRLLSRQGHIWQSR